ncbi:MAG: O-antigen ligase family protein [Bacteroidota bacterium]
MSINLDRTIYRLLCVYLFLIPFEQVLKAWFGIDTVLKPYRIAIILATGLYLVKVAMGGMSIGRDMREDGYFYLIFVYGIIISLVQMAVAPFSLGKFYNDLFLVSLSLPAFFIIKNSHFTQQQMLRLTQFFVAGISLNALNVFYNFYILRNFGRQAGFMDNPNYLALSIVIAIAFLLYRIDLRRWFWALLQVALLLVLGYTFIIAGSRGGLLALSAVLFLMFWFGNFWRKLWMGSAIFGALLLVLVSPSSAWEGATPLILVNRLNDLEVSDDPRIAIWKGTLRASEETYYLGLGIGQFKARFPEFYQGETNQTVYEVVDFGYHLSPHSDYFGILITYGIIGLLLYLFFLFVTTRRKLRDIYQATVDSVRRYHQFSFTLLLPVILFGFVADSFNSALYWALLSISTKTPN